MKDAIKKYPDELKKNMRETLIDYGNKMVAHAKRDHLFKRDSGKLQDSIEAIVPPKKVGIKFWINPTLVTVRSKRGTYNYGVIQHEGSGQYYRRSRGAKRYSRKLKRGGVQSDHFMTRAWDKYVKKMSRALKRDLVKTARKLRLK